MIYLKKSIELTETEKDEIAHLTSANFLGINQYQKQSSI